MYFIWLLISQGVGSQGDGTAQLLCRDAAAQKQVMEIISSTLSMPCLQLTLSSGACSCSRLEPQRSLTRALPIGT